MSFSILFLRANTKSKTSTKSHERMLGEVWTKRRVLENKHETNIAPSRQGQREAIGYQDRVNEQMEQVSGFMQTVSKDLLSLLLFLSLYSPPCGHYLVLSLYASLVSSLLSLVVLLLSNMLGCVISVLEIIYVVFLVIALFRLLRLIVLCFLVTSH